jgi:signal transduction histidine kinase
MQRGKSAEDFRALSFQILDLSNRDLPRIDFLREISRELLDFSGCETIKLWLNEGDKYVHTRISSRTKQTAHYEKVLSVESEKGGALPLVFGNETVGTIQFMDNQQESLSGEKIALFRDIAQVLGIAIINQRTHAALRERIKKITCLYKITQIAGREEISLGEILQAAAALLPPAWQYPRITACRISLDGDNYATPGFQQGCQQQTADIVVKGTRRGVIEVIYTKRKPQLDEGPFLNEERSLIDTIARQIALIVERKDSEKYRSELQEQLRHADRLTLIGQLASGVAHELNEPLGSILGFAQLAKKAPAFPEQANKDIDKIIKASLYAREVIKKLLVFAREVPPKRGVVDLNRVVEEGLFFFEARCAKLGIELVRSLSPEIPEIYGDLSQLNQVLINLVVNSIQAMPDGGTLTIETRAEDGYNALVVVDTGIGMSEEVKSKIFTPFFTTKDVNEGTGLGLTVAHGIITSHNGRIKVESTVGQGTRFEIQLPVA